MFPRLVVNNSEETIVPRTESVSKREHYEFKSSLTTFTPQLEVLLHSPPIPPSSHIRQIIAGYPVITAVSSLVGITYICCLPQVVGCQGGFLLRWELSSLHPHLN